MTDENKLFICFICSHVTALKNAMPFFKTSFRELPSQDCIVCNNCPEELILFQARAEGQAAALPRNRPRLLSCGGSAGTAKAVGRTGAPQSLLKAEEMWFLLYPFTFSRSVRPILTPRPCLRCPLHSQGTWARDPVVSEGIASGSGHQTASLTIPCLCSASSVCPWKQGLSL